MKKGIRILISTVIITGVLSAAGHIDLLKRYQTEANEALSAERGKALFEKKVGNKSCTGCHTDDIRKEGRAEFLIFSKSIGPMALSVNPKRFQKPEATEKDFNKYCKEVFGRVCTPREKGDLLTYFTQN